MALSFDMSDSQPPQEPERWEEPLPAGPEANSPTEFDLPFSVPPAPRRRITWRAPGAARAFLFFTAVFIVGAVIGQGMGLGIAMRLLGGRLRAHEPTSPQEVLLLLVRYPLVPFCMGATELLLSLAVTFAFTRGWDRRPLSSVGFTIDAGAGVQFLAGLALGGALMGAIFAVEAGLGWLHVHQVLPFPRAVEHAAIWLGALLPAAAAEEVMLRDYTFQALQEQWGGTAATLITAVMFGALHGINPHAGWGSFAGILVSGILFGAAVLATGRLWLPIGLHVAWNLFEGPVLGFPVSGFVFPSDLTPVVTGPPLWTGGRFGPEAGLLGTLACAAGALILLAIARGRPNQHGDTETRRGSPRSGFLQG
jgi:uncharacterized protein